jgi:hypothetical protein
VCLGYLIFVLQVPLLAGASSHSSCWSFFNAGQVMRVGVGSGGGGGIGVLVGVGCEVCSRVPFVVPASKPPTLGCFVSVPYVSPSRSCPSPLVPLFSCLELCLWSVRSVLCAGLLGEWSCEVGFELSWADSAQLDMWLWSFLPLVRRPCRWHPSPCRSSIACCEWGFVGF